MSIIFIWNGSQPSPRKPPGQQGSWQRTGKTRWECYLRKHFPRLSVTQCWWLAIFLVWAGAALSNCPPWSQTVTGVSLLCYLNVRPVRGIVTSTTNILLIEQILLFIWQRAAPDAQIITEECIKQLNSLLTNPENEEIMGLLALSFFLDVTKLMTAGIVIQSYKSWPSDL